MSKERKKSLRQAFLKADSRAKFRTEEAVAHLRHYWQQWDAELRAEFKSWLEKIINLRNAPPDVFPELTLIVKFSAPDGEESFAPPLEAMLRAIECWEKGEFFAPVKFQEAMR